jgi:hypothetical protein
MKNRALLTVVIFGVCALALPFIGTSQAMIDIDAASVLAADDSAPKPWAVLLLLAACVLYQGRRRVRRFNIADARSERRWAKSTIDGSRG